VLEKGKKKEIAIAFELFHGKKMCAYFIIFLFCSYQLRGGGMCSMRGMCGMMQSHDISWNLQMFRFSFCLKLQSHHFDHQIMAVALYL